MLIRLGIQMVAREGESCYNTINLTMIAKPQVEKKTVKDYFDKK